ncbi:unnamed protein product [Paramecium octaurelia]|uniref:VLIG-type G domain-containing protein n=1 Tax=Paramecium octaurelia TaxID=43137 RepID=A0A8S1VCP4_PAROT|nr:unnamed protein product [Paramecium octaurelia]
MSETLYLSDYINTCEMFAIVNDRERQNFRIPSTPILTQIIQCFLNKLNNNDKQLAIKYLTQYFSNNTALVQMRKELDGEDNILKKPNYLNDYGLKKNQIAYEQNEKLNLIRQDEDFQQLMELIEQKDFKENFQIPTLLHQYKHIIEKLKNHSFKLLDIIEQCKNSSFQLNSTTLSNLVFFFYIPEELQISSKEKDDLYQLLGEITCECWMQFEYHIQQLQFQESNENILKILSEIPQLLVQPDLQMLKNQMSYVLGKMLDKKDQILKFEEIDTLIQKNLPITFELQVIFYQICFYCMANFNQYYEKYMITSNKDERYKQLNIYIEQKKQSSLEQFNQIQINSFQQYSNEQLQIKDEWKTLISQSLDEMLQIIIEYDFHYLNKKLHVFHLSQQNDQMAKIFNLLTEIPVQDKRKVACFLKTFTKPTKIIQVEELSSQIKTFPIQILEVIFRIIIEIKNYDFTIFLFLKQTILENRKITEKKISQKISKYFQNIEMDKSILLLKDFSDDDWQFIKQHKIQQKIVNFLIQQYFETKQQLQGYILQFLRKLCYQNQPVQQMNEQTQFFTYLFSFLNDEQIHQLISVNKQNSISLNDYLNTVETLFQLVNSINEEELQNFKSNLENVLDRNLIYSLDFFFELQNDKVNLEQLKNIYKLVYFWKQRQQQELKKNAEQFYRIDANQYKLIFVKINYFGNEYLAPEKLEQLIKCDMYPRCLDITLEEFNISLTLLSKEEQQNLVNNWIKEAKDSNNFKKLIPFFFNIIKRGESSKTFLSIINQQIKSQKELQQKFSYFNQKAMFQIFYNNANNELKVMLLKLISKQYPIPLLYRTFYNAEAVELEKLTFNINTFYVFQDNIPIINLSLDEKQKRIGKTKLINKIFFQQNKFEIQDSNQLNNQTIDIMYDFEFRGSRNLSVADAHNFIPFEILDDILPMFKLWIIQLDTEKEIEMTVQNLQKLQSFQIQEKIVCFLIRNSIQDLDGNQKQLLQSLNIQFKQIMDLSDKDLNKQMKDDEIEQVSKFLYDIINQNRKNFTINQDQYFNLICQMKQQDLEQIKEMKLAQELFQEIETELDHQMKHEQGFYNQKAFPLRSIDWQIKQEKDAYVRIEQSKDQNKYAKLQQVNQNINHLQSQIRLQQQTNLISKFCSLLKSPNNYILYLHFVDKIRKFNEKNTFELQAKNQNLNEEIQQLKKDRDVMKSKDMKSDQIEQTDKKQNEINQKVLELKKNSDIISKRSIGIELFWREIIAQIEQCPDSQIDIDPAKIVKKMISKGEPYEFLDGDLLRIDQAFLMKLISYFKEQGQEKILVLSVLGPKSSGKSTILNKIFGCNFWTSVGRCTKGIYFQLLKIHNKALFNNQFDSIIILDTEGLQSPNQDDQEFDKKIALFILSISDIILVNVKGDITREFRSLLEMCIFILGQMKSFTSSKQITWCFNQNNDANNYAPFLAQLQKIATSLSTELGNQKDEDEPIDYNQILGITQGNIKILGFASTEKLWKQNQSDGVYENWRQLILNGTQSEEAYEYGIKVIGAYIDKFGEGDDQKGQGKQMENLKQFIQKIETTWRSIESLPDLLEFSELIQHQQNQFMKQQFTDIIDVQMFPKQNDFIKIIQESIQQQNYKLSLEALSTIERQQLTNMKGEFDQIKNAVIERLTAIKNDKKISKKIFTKYLNMTNDRINSEVSACNLAIYSEIKTQETNLQKKKGFFQFDLFIQSLLKKEEEFQEYKKDENKIQNKFNEIWDYILNHHIQQQEEIFKDYCDQLLQAIQQEFQEYRLKTNNEPQYKQEYHKQLIKNPPQDNDFLISLAILNPELQHQQFMVVEKSIKNYQFYEKFCQTIPKKLDKINDQYILQINKFYSQKIEIKWITKNIFENYIKTGLKDDLIQYHQETKRYERQAIKFFLDQFTIFGYTMDDKQIDTIYSVLDSWFRSDLSKKLCQCFILNQREFYNDIQYQLSIQFINKHCKNLTILLQKKEQIISLSDNLDNLLKQYDQGDCYLIQIQKQIIFNGNFETLDIDLYNTSLNASKSSQIIATTQVKSQSLPNSNFSSSTKSQVNQTYRQEIVKDIFEYILNPQYQQHKYNQFKNYVVKAVQQLMNQNYNEGWNKMYGEVHKMILDENIDKKNNVVENENTKVNQNIFNLIKRIMQKIEVKIKEFNMQFSDFGVILNDIGERCLYYFAIFTIWRILCFGQYQSTESNIKELRDQTDEQYIKFKADIQQYKKEQSKIRGQTQAQEIINQVIQRFYKKYCEEANKIIAIYNQESSFDIMKKLDKDILERGDKNITDDQIMEYMRNQSKYIEKYVKEKISTIKQEISTKLTNQLKKDLKSHLQKVSTNTKNLHDFVFDSLQAQDYFKKLPNPDEAPQLLYKIVLSCLQGQVEKSLLELIKEDKRDAFQTQDFHIFDYPLCVAIQKSDAEIQILLDFVSAFEKKIKDGISGIDALQIEFEKLNVQADLDALQLKQIGCLEFCPICKRKCDEEIDDSNHKHQCKNGHQLRGMCGVLIGCYPSLYTCEEIQDDFQIKELETQNIKQWKEIKQTYNNWIFSCFLKDEQKQLKEKFMKIWNQNIGQMICKRLTEELKRDILYVPKQEVKLGANQGNSILTHYVLMLDDSCSMSGRPFESAKQGLVAFLYEIQKNPNLRVTIIMFNSRSRCVVDYQVPNAQAQQTQIVFSGGGTNFDDAFLLAYDKISSNPDFNKFQAHSIFFYTDGGDSYPKQAMDKFNQLPIEKRQKIELIACSEEQNPTTLAKVVEFFKINLGSAQLKTSMQPDKIAQVWIEEVSKLVKQNKNC